MEESVTVVLGVADVGFAAEIEVDTGYLGTGASLEEAARNAFLTYARVHTTRPALHFWVPDYLRPLFDRQYPQWNWAAWGK